MSTVVTTPRCTALAMLILVTGLAGRSSAQVVAQPPGSNRGVFGGEGGAPGSGLSLTVDLDGGYDNNSVSESDAPGGQFGAFQSGYVTTAGGSLRYQVGRAERYVVGVGSGSVTQQQIARGSSFFRLVQGGGMLQTATTLGRRSGLTATAAASYEPTFLFGAFDSLGLNAGDVSPLEPSASPTADPTLSLTQQRWLLRRAGGSAHRDFTSRQRTSLQYDGLWLRPVAGPGFESHTHTTALTHAWNPRPSAGFDLLYRYNRNAQTIEGAVAPLVNLQTAEARFRYERRLSPNRTLSFMLGGGVVGVSGTAEGDGSRVSQFSPTVSGTARLAFLPTWGVSLSARRDITLLNGLSPEPFVSNAATLTVDGTAWGRLTMSATGGYSQGRARQSAVGDYDQTLLNTQLGYGFGAAVGLVATYAYNQHAFRDVPLAPSTFPTRFGRHSFRLGLTMWLPLYGSF